MRLTVLHVTFSLLLASCGPPDQQQFSSDQRAAVAPLPKTQMNSESDLISGKVFDDGFGTRLEFNKTTVTREYTLRSLEWFQPATFPEKGLVRARAVTQDDPVKFQGGQYLCLTPGIGAEVLARLKVPIQWVGDEPGRYLAFVKRTDFAGTLKYEPGDTIEVWTGSYESIGNKARITFDEPSDMWELSNFSGRNTFSSDGRATVDVEIDEWGDLTGGFGEYKRVRE